MKRPLSTWERDVVTALVSIDGPEGSPTSRMLRESVPHLVVTAVCDCGCPSFFVEDGRRAPPDRETGTFHFSNATTPDGRVGLFLLVKDDRPWSIDVMLPPDIKPSSSEARPDPRSFSVTSPYSE